MDTEGIAARLRFLAFIALGFSQIEAVISDAECEGFMYLLQDLADWIDPQPEKEGAE